VPGSAVLARKEIGEAADKLTLHGHTHSCYPAMCASALKNLEIIAREKLAENSAGVGAYLNQKLRELQQKYPEIGDVRGRGLLQGFELVKDRKTKEAHFDLGAMLFKRMLEEGLVTELESRRNLRNVVVVLHPPLIASKADADSASDIIDKSMADCLKRL
jgi:taurine--2-oxoglutarate transaminase